MAKQSKPIHLIQIRWSYGCHAVCDKYIEVEPIGANIIKSNCRRNPSKGTFNPKKVTCKRCLKHSDYKIALDKVKNPLFYWRENI